MSDQRKEFWDEFKEFADNIFKLGTASTGEDYSHKILTGFHPRHITVRSNKAGNYIRCQIRFERDEDKQIKLWNHLQEHIAQVRTELGLNEMTEWRDYKPAKEEMKNPTITLSRWVPDLYDKDKRIEYHAWLVKNAALLIFVINKYYKKIEKQV